MTVFPRNPRGLFENFSGLLHGGDYNPEQWLDRPEILDADPKLMLAANVNQATVGVFAWAALEPKPGEYNFSWLDETFERLHAHKVRIILATPSAARPRWLAEGSPEVMRTRRDGRRIPPGEGRHNHCLSSPVLRERVARIDEALSERYGQHPALLCWHIGNEFGGDEDGARCYCERCIAGFQDWLSVRYQGDLDALNRAWWSSFWSHSYSSWQQIRPGDDSIEALGLNYRRYQSDLVSAFCAFEIAAVRRHSQRSVTTNMFGDLSHYDHPALARHLDFASYDGYPFLDGSHADRDQLHAQVFFADIVRSFQPGRPWLLMESCPSVPQWQGLARLKRPHVYQALSLAMLARGSDGVCYFQWRAGRGGMEKLHGAVLMQDAPSDTRVFREVKALGGCLAALDGVAGTTLTAPAAVVWDVESEWARALNSGLSKLPSPQADARAWHACFWQAGITVDVPDSLAEFDRYRVVVVPGVFLLRPGFVERLERAVQSGTHVLIDGLSAWVDDDLACVSRGRPGALRAALGLRCEELDQLRLDEYVTLQDSDNWLGGDAQASRWVDHVHVTDCTVLVRACDHFHDGWPVLTRRSVGEGSFWYLAAGLEPTSRAHLVRRICAEADVASVLPADSQPVVAMLRGQHTESFLFLINAGDSDARVRLPDGRYRDATTKVQAEDTLLLHGWESRVLQRSL